jgi:hypothetical protein
VSSAELLNYALLNRQEWEQRGREIVAEYVESFARDEAALLSAREDSASALAQDECGVETTRATEESAVAALAPPSPPPMIEEATENDTEHEEFAGKASWRTGYQKEATHRFL